MNQESRIKNKINTIIHNSLFIIRNVSGFTLIEIMAVFSVTAILSVVGIAAFINYSRVSALNSAASEVVAMLNVAKSRAQSQVKPSICSETGKQLNGYQVSICSDSGPCPDEFDYQLDVVCSVPPAGLPTAQSPSIEQKNLPSNYNLKFNFDSGKTTTQKIIFNVVDGKVTGEGNIVIDFKSGYGDGCKNINVNAQGIISQTDC